MRVFEESHLGKLLFKMTLPMLLGVLSLMSYQLADSVFIAQLGVEPLAIMGFTMPVYMLVIGVQVGIGIATTALIAQALGAEQNLLARQLAALILVCGALTILLLVLGIWWFRFLLLDLMGGEPSLRPLLAEFWIAFLPSAWFGAMLYFGYSICRANGNTKLPGFTMIITSLLNIALDALYIFGFGWGIQGAAYASLTSFLIGIVIIYPKLFKHAWVLVEFAGLSLMREISKISQIALPAMVSQMIPPLSAMLATAIVAVYGTDVVAAWGLGGRMELFSIFVILALTMSLPPIVGRFHGARSYEKVWEVIAIALKFTLIWQSLLAIAWFIGAQELSHFMTPDDELKEIVTWYIQIVPLSYGPLGVCMILVSAANACGMPIRSVVISMLRLFLCFLPCVWLGGLIGDIKGLLIGALVGNALAGLQAYYVFRKGYADLHSLDTRTA